MKDSTQLGEDLFHFLTSLTQEKKYAHGNLFHFLMSLTQEKEICSWNLVNKLDTRKGIMLMGTFFIF